MEFRIKRDTRMMVELPRSVIVKKQDYPKRMSSN